jgi:hypothetical protein
MERPKDEIEVVGTKIAIVLAIIRDAVNVGDESHDLLCLQMTTALEAVVNVRG